MSAASMSLDDDDDSTTSSDGGGYLGIARGQKEFPGHPHLGGKTMVGGKTIKSLGGKTFKSETSTDNDTDDEEENQNELILFEADNNDEGEEAEAEEEEEEEQSDVDEETEEEEDAFQQIKCSPPKALKPKLSIPVVGTKEQQSQLEAWKEVHASLTEAVLIAREAIASKKLQRRFWLETICANLSHPSEAKTTSIVNSSESFPSQIPLLLPHSVWFKPDQRKKKRGSKKQPIAPTTSEDAPKTKKARRKKSPTALNKTTLALLSGGTKKKVVKGASLVKKRKIAMLPLKAKKKRANAALPTKKQNIRLSINTSKVVPPEAKANAPVLSVFQDDSDDDDSDGAEAVVAVAMEDDEDESDNFVLAREEEDEEDSEDAADQPMSNFWSFASNADEDSSSEDEDEDKKMIHTAASGKRNERAVRNGEDKTGDGPNEANSSDNDGPDWNSSQRSHPFLKKRRTSINTTTQGNLDSSEIYSTFRPGEENEETKGDEADQDRETTSSRMMGSMGGFGAFGGSDSSEDEIPF